MSRRHSLIQLQDATCGGETRLIWRYHSSVSPSEQQIRRYRIKCIMLPLTPSFLSLALLHAHDMMMIICEFGDFRTLAPFYTFDLSGITRSLWLKTTLEATLPRVIFVESPPLHHHHLRGGCSSLLTKCRVQLYPHLPLAFLTIACRRRRHPSKHRRARCLQGPRKIDL